MRVGSNYKHLALDALMARRTALSGRAGQQSDSASFARLMVQPQAMKTRKYASGIDTLNGNDAWTMFKACAAGDIPKVRTLLTKDARLVNAQFWYQFPLHFAVRDGNAELVELLLNHGADSGQSTYTYDSWPKLLDIADDRGFADVKSVLVRHLKRQFNYSPNFELLKDAIISRSPRKVGAVLRKHPKLVKAADALGNNALHWSVITRQLDLIARFVDLGTPLEAKRANGQTPLLVATSGGYDYWHRDAWRPGHPSLRNPAVMVGYLLAHGAKYTISTAAAIGDQECVEAILAKNPEEAVRLNSARRTPLSYAAAKGHTHIAQILLEHGADPNAAEEGAPNGFALFSACQGNHQDTAKLLLEHGADPNAGADSSGCCLTICEVYHGKQAKPLQKLLRSYGAYTPPYAMKKSELKQALRDEEPAVHHEEFLENVVAKCDDELLDLCLAFDPNMPQKIGCWGGMPHPGFPKLLRRLIDHGLDVNRRDWLGRTFLHGCAESFDTTIAAELLDAGANINARDAEFQETPLATAIRSDPWCPDEKDRPKIEADRKHMAGFLLERGAAASLPDDAPWTSPLTLARKRGFTEIEALLIEHSAIHED